MLHAPSSTSTGRPPTSASCARSTTTLTAEIRQRAAAEEENAGLAREAARAAALDELSQLKSRFISVASHELRTPLTGIINATALALADTGAGRPAPPPADGRPELRRPARPAGRQPARHLAHRGRPGLDPRRRRSTSRRPCGPDRRPAGGAPRGTRSSPRSRRRPRRALADPDRLRQILTNLVGNAIKYSPAGGQVRISTRPGAAPGRVEILVADQGLGIPPEELDRIFDPYQRGNSTATRRISGAGLGLYIVRSLVELHGGSIRVESEVGRGSTFRLVLPSAELGASDDVEPADRPPAPGPDAEGDPGRRGRRLPARPAAPRPRARRLPGPRRRGRRGGARRPSRSSAPT